MPAGEPLERLPEEVTVSLAEIRAAIVELEALLAEFRRAAEFHDQGDKVDAVIGRMTRWVWPLLGELDDEGR